MHPIVDYIHNVHAKKTVPCKGLVILLLKAVNAERPFHYRLPEGSFRPEVVTRQTHKVLCAVAELLGRGGQMDSLV